MDFIIDNKETEEIYREILRLINARKNGEVSDGMKNNGLVYKLNWGVSILDLREIAGMFEKNHLLALKLWNKQWRETMILATMLDNPNEVSEEQMDFWTKSFENPEIAEQASSNLWAKSKFAFIKSLEWCRGKKHWVKFTGIHLMGRLAISEKTAIDEMFEPFFPELQTLAKDKKLHTILYRSVLAVAKRSEFLYQLSLELAQNLKLSGNENSINLGEELSGELNNDYFKDCIQKN